MIVTDKHGDKNNTQKTDGTDLLRRVEISLGLQVSSPSLPLNLFSLPLPPSLSLLPPSLPSPSLSLSSNYTSASGLQNLGLGRTDPKEVLRYLDPAEAGVVGLRAFIEALAWRQFRYTSLEALLEDLYRHRLQRGFISAAALGIHTYLCVYIYVCIYPCIYSCTCSSCSASSLLPRLHLFLRVAYTHPSLSLHLFLSMMPHDRVCFARVRYVAV